MCRFDRPPVSADGRRSSSSRYFFFGAAAHIIAQVACWEGREVFAIVRPGDDAAKEFARDLGAVWAGDSGEAASEPLDAAIIFAPVGSLVPIALRAVMPAGIVVCAGIHMSDISAFPYEILWEERQIRSVANLTLRDGEEFLKLAPKVPVKTSVSLYGLEEANDALSGLREGRLQGGSGSYDGLRSCSIKAHTDATGSSEPGSMRMDPSGRRIAIRPVCSMTAYW